MSLYKNGRNNSAVATKFLVKVVSGYSKSNMDTPLVLTSISDLNVKVFLKGKKSSTSSVLSNVVIKRVSEHINDFLLDPLTVIVIS